MAPASASVVIPTTMRRDTVRPVAEAAVEAIAAMPEGEVILVANGPAEGRRPLGFRSPRLRVVELPQPKMSAARNAGMTEARNDAVLLTDDDCLISRAWAERLARRLGDGEISVGTPLEMRPDGPVTGFLAYQRIFHPRPIDASTVDYPLLASMGIRRDLIGFGFDEDLASGDELQFGARLREAGVSTPCDPEAPPPVHLLPERLESVTERFQRYGVSNANVLLRKGQLQYTIPSPTALYSSLGRAQITTPRRFEEISDPRLRRAFATLDLCLLGCFLVGYLEEAGRALGREIIGLDQKGLATGWTGIQRHLDEASAWDGDWRRVPLDFDRWRSPQETRAPDLLPDVAEVLRRNAPLTEPPGPDPDLDRGAEQIAQRSEERRLRIEEAWGDLRDGRLPATEVAIAGRLREAGIAFRDGMQAMETIALGPVAPAPEAAARAEPASRTESRG